jgi:AraC-like DNA-binding protein
MSERRSPDPAWRSSIRTRNVDDWSGALAETYGVMGVEPEAESPFAASLARRDFDRLKAVELCGTPQVFHRTAPMIGSDSPNDFILTMAVDGRGLIIQDGRTASLGPGEFALVENARPYSMVMLEHCRIIDYTWPREAVGLTDTESREITARTFGSASPMGRLLSPMLANLHRVGDELSEAGAIRLSGVVADLLVTAALELSQPDGSDVRIRQQYEAMTRFIEGRLDDPDLSAESVAEEFFFSSRTVHRVFARNGTTVASAIRDLRLEASRTMLLSAAYRTTSIGYIASHFGFSSLPVFSRAFAARYGVSPTVYRSQHR